MAEVASMFKRTWIVIEFQKFEQAAHRQIPKFEQTSHRQIAAVRFTVIHNIISV